MERYENWAKASKRLLSNLKAIDLCCIIRTEKDKVFVLNIVFPQTRDNFKNR